MKKIVSTLLVIAVVIVSVCLTGCNMRFSSYRAVLLVQTNTDHKATISFHELTGTMVVKLKVDGDSEMQMAYSAKLNNGKAEVFYEYNGEKTDLLTIESGEEINSVVGPFTTKGTIYITIKTTGTCDEGSFAFELK